MNVCHSREVDRAAPLRLRDRFHSDEKRGFYEIIITFIDFQVARKDEEKSNHPLESCRITHLGGMQSMIESMKTKIDILFGLDGRDEMQS